MTPFRNLFLAAGAVLICVATPASAQEWGRFEGELVVVMSGSPDGRRVRLREPYAYFDRHNVRWRVPAGKTVDGASIPKAFWPLIGGPFEGLYRDASVIHDYFCDEESRPWEQVHRAFYEAMRANGVDEVQAKAMYFAVYKYGPRWDDRGTYHCGPFGLFCMGRGARRLPPPPPSPPPPPPPPPVGSPEYPEWERKEAARRIAQEQFLAEQRITLEVRDGDAETAKAAALQEVAAIEAQLRREDLSLEELEAKATRQLVYLPK